MRFRWTLCLFSERVSLKLLQQRRSVTINERYDINALPYAGFKSQVSRGSRTREKLTLARLVG